MLKLTAIILNSPTLWYDMYLKKKIEKKKIVTCLCITLGSHSTSSFFNFNSVRFCPNLSTLLVLNSYHPPFFTISKILFVQCQSLKTFSIQQII